MRLITLTPITGSGEDMFDGYLETQTETANEISKTFSVAGLNAVVVLNNYGVEASLRINGPQLAYYSLDEGSGAIAIDNSGNGNDGTITGSPVWGGGVSGGGLIFDGVDDTVYAPTLLLPNDAFSINLWIKTYTIESGKYSAIFDSPNFIKIRLDANILNVFVYSSGSYEPRLSGPVISENIWYNISVTWDGSLLSLYVNGVIYNSITRGPITATSGVYIGTGATDKWLGEIDEVRIYDESFDAQKISNLYLYGNPDGQTTQTISLIRDSIKDWWDYFFAPSRIGRDCVFYFPTQPAGSTATLKIKYPGGTAKCGMCITGLAKNIMSTGYDLKIGISDYSKYVTNDFGNVYLNPGPWSKTVDAGLFTNKANLDVAFRDIIKNRGTACVFDYNEYQNDLTEYHTSENGFSSLVVYGHTDDFSSAINSGIATATHSAKGLI